MVVGAAGAGGGCRCCKDVDILSSVPNPSGGAGGAGPRMDNYAIHASGTGGQAVQVAPRLLGIKTSVMANTTTGGIGGARCAIIGGSAASASVSVPLSVLCSVSGTSSSRRSDSKSTTSSGSANEGIDIDIDIDIDGGESESEDVDSNHYGLHRRRRSEQDIELDMVGYTYFHYSMTSAHHR